MLFHFVQRSPAVACEVEVVIAAATQQLNFGDSVRLHGSSTLPEAAIASILWQPQEGLSCTDCFSPWARPFETTTYTCKVIDRAGCESTTAIPITVDRSRGGGSFVPAAFSPDGDGINDYFTIYGGRTVSSIKKLRIFDRWGEMVFVRAHFPPNDPVYGWNGNFRNEAGQPMSAAVFAYWAEVELIDGTVQLLKGDLTLVR